MHSHAPQNLKHIIKSLFPHIINLFFLPLHSMLNPYSRAKAELSSLTLATSSLSSRPHQSPKPSISLLIYPSPYNCSIANLLYLCLSSQHLVQYSLNNAGVGVPPPFPPHTHTDSKKSAYNFPIVPCYLWVIGFRSNSSPSLHRYQNLWMLESLL